MTPRRVVGPFISANRKLADSLAVCIECKVRAVVFNDRANELAAIGDGERVRRFGSWEIACNVLTRHGRFSLRLGEKAR
jgi:hypothetical protein